MNIQTKTLKNGFVMPSIGKGTWMTDINKKKHSSINEASYIEDLHSVLHNGVTYIDSAERYASGYGEALIGKAIADLDRAKLFLTSKVSARNLNYENVISSAKRSLKRMNVSYFDLYLIHAYSSTISLQETMKAMDYLVEKKMIKHIGVCNFTPEQMKEAQSYTQNKIVVNQLRYNLMEREDKKTEIVEYCQKNDMMVIAWRPYNQKQLSQNTKVLLDEMSQKLKTTPEQLSVKWLLVQSNVVVLGRINTVAHLKDMVGAQELKMSTEDIKKMTQESN